MTPVLADFRLRSKEVEVYFDFVLRLGTEQVSFNCAVGDAAPLTATQRAELFKTLKASCFLLLYNLVESTMRNAIEAIFEEMRRNRISFDICREELRLEILRNLKRRDTEKLLPRLVSLAESVVCETFERTELFAGNLDARSIRETAKRFGFAEPNPNGDFWLLRTVKDTRNDLAHGVKSFSEVGRDAVLSELENARVQVFTILEETIRNIDSYLANREYLVTTQNMPPPVC